MSNQSRVYTKHEMMLIEKSEMPSREVAEKIGVCMMTIYRLRKKLGIKANGRINNGRLENKERRICRRKDCNIVFYVVPSRTKSYCSHSCHTQDAKPWENRKKRKFDYDTASYNQYKKAVYKESNIVYEENIETINPNRYLRARNGTKNAWQLDHIKPVVECFKEGWTIEEASAVSNLRMLPWKDNVGRNKKNA